MNKVDSRIHDWITSHQILVMREKRSGRAVGVSYTEDGLKYVVTKTGQLPYYKKAFIEGGKAVGDLTKSESIVIEKFVPRDLRNGPLWKAEVMCVAKATHMLYGKPWPEIPDSSSGYRNS